MRLKKASRQISEIWIFFAALAVPQALQDFPVLKGEWVNAYRDWYRDIYWGYRWMILGIHSPTPLSTALNPKDYTQEDD